MSDARITLSAVDKTAQAFSTIKQRMAGLAAEVEGLGARFAAIGVTVGSALALRGFFNNIVNGLDSLNDLKDATGASIGNLSALEDIAARAGTEFAVVSTSLTKLNQALLAAKPGDGISATLKAIGLQAKQLRELDPAEALLRVAEGLEQFADDGNKARATQVLVGRSLREVAPLLKDLAEAGRLNATVTDEQAQQAEIFNKQLAQFSKNATDAGRAIAGPLLKSINDLTAGLTRASANQGGLLAGIGQQFEDDFLRARLQATQEEIERLASSAQRAREVLARQPDSIRAKATLAEFAALEKQAQDYRTRIDAILYGGGSRRPANEGGGSVRRASIGEIPDAPKADRLSEYAQALARTLVSEKELGQEQQTRLDIAVGKLGKLNQGQADYLVGLARAIDLQNKGDPLGAFVTDQLQRQNDRDRASVQQLVDSSTGARFDALVALTQRTTAAYQAGALSLQDYARAAKSLGAAFDALEPQVEKVTATVNTFAEQAGRNIQDTLGDSLVRALDGDFKSIEKLWADTLKKMLAQALAAELNSALFGGTFGQQGGKLGGIVGNLLTGGLSGLFGGARATGGPVQAGRAYLVGERGPEMIVPANSGTVIPNSALGGGAVNINQTINVGQGVSRGEVAAATLQAKDAAVAEIRALMFRTGRGAL